ncbi:MAG: cyclic nucleotide-binding domain-containing protein [Ilumatobacteraceae bacterium]
MPQHLNPLTTLHHVPLFSSCSKKDLARIVKASDKVSFKAGRVMIEQGQPGREAFIMLNGKATVRRNGKKLASLGAGSMVGELALLDHGPRTATVTCDTDCDVLVISQRHFHGVLDDVPALSHKLLSQLASRLRDLDRTAVG